MLQLDKLLAHHARLVIFVQVPWLLNHIHVVQVTTHHQLTK